MKKLCSLLNVFRNGCLILDELRMQKDFETLRSYIPEMFPIANKEVITGHELDLAKKTNDIVITSSRNDNRNNLYNEFNLPYHTRDNVWLTAYLARLIKGKLNSDPRLQKSVDFVSEKTKPNDNVLHKNLLWAEHNHDLKIKYNNIKKFVEIDHKFDEARNAYEVDLTRAQIRYMMCNTKPNGILMSHHAKHKRTFHPGFSPLEIDADKLFRNTVFESMTQIGLSQHSVEVGLEKYANLWRNPLMVDACYNQYLADELNFNNADTTTSDTSIKESFSSVWLREREAQYYQAHKEIIDEVKNNQNGIEL